MQVPSDAPLCEASHAALRVSCMIWSSNIDQKGMSRPSKSFPVDFERILDVCLDMMAAPKHDMTVYGFLAVGSSKKKSF